MENLNEMLQIRRQKLQELLDANENPYVHENLTMLIIPKKSWIILMNLMKKKLK